MTCTWYFDQSLRDWGKHFTRKTKNRGKSEGEKALIKRKKMDFDYLAPTQQLDSSDTEDLDESTSSSKIFGIVKVSGENIQEESFEIRRGENVIGRDRSQCQIVLQCQVRKLPIINHSLESVIDFVLICSPCQEPMLSSRQKKMVVL